MSGVTGRALLMSKGQRLRLWDKKGKTASHGHRSHNIGHHLGRRGLDLPRLTLRQI